MAFRRQDIPKTTRKGADGEPRRVYPRFARDRSLLPKVDLAIGYLDGMVGRRRGDLAADTVVELFGDPKLARCMVTTLADSYRYRTPSFSDVVGRETAASLAGWDIMTPSQLRAHVYLAAHARSQGVVTTSERMRLLEQLATPLGLEPAQLDELLHLDAERNAILVRTGPRPRPDDAVARYNVLLALSVVRHAATIHLLLPGLSPSAVETVCCHHDVAVRGGPTEGWTLSGRRNALGSFVSFGARLARCALHLMLLSPDAPSGAATVHLGDRVMRWVLDGAVVSLLRPRVRVAASAEDIVRTALLSQQWAALRRKEGGHGAWRVTKAVEPIVTAGAIVLPELLFTRDDTTVTLIGSPADGDTAQVHGTLVEIAATRSVVICGDPVEGVTTLTAPDATTLLSLLDEIGDQTDVATTPVHVIRTEINAAGWVGVRRVEDLLGVTTEAEIAARLQPMMVDGEVALVPGFGVCRIGLIDNLLDQVGTGPVDISAVRYAIGRAVGDGPGADALTLYLLAQTSVIRRPQPVEAAA